MTTIAYRDGVLAADSLCTSHGMRDGKAVKARRIKGVLAASCGSAALGEKFFDWIKNGLKGTSPWQGNDDGNGMIITPERHVLLFGNHGVWRLDTDYAAMGSGERFAMGAMAHGATAVEAVEAAIKLDVYTGGPVRTVAL